MPDKKLKILFLTQESLETIYILNGIQEREQIQVLIVEKPETPVLTRKQKITSALKTFFARSLLLNFVVLLVKLTGIFWNEEKIHRKMLFGGRKEVRFAGTVPKYEEKNINSKKSVERIRSFAPDLIIVAGTSLIKKPIIDIPRLGIINIHMGITPHYRGTNSEFHALYNHDFHNIGFTIHFLDEGIDSGPVLYQERITVKPDDNPFTLRAKSTLACVDAFVKVIRMFQEGRVEAKPHTERGTVYKGPRNLQKLKVFGECIIRKYITHKV